MNPYLPLFESLCAAVHKGRRVAFCLVAATRGSTPQSPGAAMLVHESLETEGTLGGGCVEAEARRRAAELLRRGESRLLSFILNHDFGWDDGLVCGGKMEIAICCVVDEKGAAPFENAIQSIKSLSPAPIRLEVANESGQRLEYRLNLLIAPELIIAGGGNVGLALAQIARDLDFRITVIDDREEFANPRRFPPPIRLVASDIESTLRAMPLGPQSYVVIVTRGHKHDKAALAAVIEKPARYIGMIGSRRKIRMIYEDLEAAGVSDSHIENVHAPIGLAIGAQTVNEIAVSIAAQLVQIRRQTPENIVEGPFDPATGQLIARAPREASDSSAWEK